MIDSFSHIPRLYGTVEYLLVTSLSSMFTVNDVRCTNLLETANKQRIKAAYSVTMNIFRKILFSF